MPINCYNVNYFTYSKALEPLFVLIFSYIILEESQELRVKLTIIPICLGVMLIAYNEPGLSLIGFTYAFAANISSAARSIFYKSTLNSKSPESSSLTKFLNIGFVSFCLYLPFYVIKVLFIDDDFLSALNNKSLFDSKLFEKQSNWLFYLVFASLFNFSYNLFSLQVLSNVSPISHSVANIMKRVFIIFCSLITFNTPITCLQWFGMFFADIGVFLYSILKIRSKMMVKVNISQVRKDQCKQFIVFLVAFILVESYMIQSRVEHQPVRLKESQSRIQPTRSLNFTDFEVSRMKCIDSIKG